MVNNKLQRVGFCNLNVKLIFEPFSFPDVIIVDNMFDIYPKLFKKEKNNTSRQYQLPNDWAIGPHEEVDI